MPETDAVVPEAPRDGEVAEEMTLEEYADCLLDEQRQQRMWLREIRYLLATRTHEADPSGRVQLAYDKVHIAACERVCRILNSDVPPIEETI